VKLKISEPHRRDDKIIGYFLACHPDNAEWSGKYITIDEYRHVTGEVVSNMPEVKIEPAPVTIPEAPVVSSNGIFGKKRKSKK